MTFQLSINTDNAAFTPEPYAEMARLLREIADRLDTVKPVNQSGNHPTKNLGDYGDGGWTGHFQTVRDINGNDVGRYAFKER